MGYQVPPNSGLQNFATASRWCFQQNSSTVELVDRIYEVTVEAPYVEERTYSLLSLHIGVVTVVQYFVCPIYIF